MMVFLLLNCRLDLRSLKSFRCFWLNRSDRLPRWANARWRTMTSWCILYRHWSNTKRSSSWWQWIWCWVNIMALKIPHEQLNQLSVEASTLLLTHIEENIIVHRTNRRIYHFFEIRQLTCILLKWMHLYIIIGKFSLLRKPFSSSQRHNLFLVF